MLFCTVARKEQMANAIVWAKAIRYYHPDSTLVLGMLEHSAPPDQTVYFDEAVFLSNRGVPALTAESGCAAITSFIKSILDSTEHEMVVYLDPETRMYTPFEELHQLLQNHSIVVVPYLLEPSSDPAKEVERIQKGLFYAGFVGLRNSPEAGSFVEWWAHVVHESFYGPDKDPFADSRWLDVTMDIHNIHMLKDPAYNLCAWNVSEGSRAIRTDNSGVRLADGRWLRSMNFYDPDGLLNQEVMKLKAGKREPLLALIKGNREELQDAVPSAAEPSTILRRKKKPAAKKLPNKLAIAKRIRNRLKGRKKIRLRYKLRKTRTAKTLRIM